MEVLASQFLEPHPGVRRELEVHRRHAEVFCLDGPDEVVPADLRCDGQRPVAFDFVPSAATVSCGKTAVSGGRVPPNIWVMLASSGAPWKLCPVKVGGRLTSLNSRKAGVEGGPSRAPGCRCRELNEDAIAVHP